MQITDFQIDSRLIQKNSLFFAIKGKKVDPHNFLKEVISKKAIGAVISKSFKLNLSYPNDFKLFKVNNVKSFLQGFAAYELKKCYAKKIGITGSYGKTTTKEFIYTLMKNFKTSKTYKNYNSQLGLPIAILNMDKTNDYLIFEMGMDKKNQISNLIKIAPLDVALITSITEFNQQGFKSSEDVAMAKGEIFNSNSINIINHNLLKYENLKNKKDFTYSIYDEKADFFFDLKNNTFRDFENNKIDILFPFKETHLIENAIGAISVLKVLNIQYEKFLENIKFLKTQNMRFEKVIINNITFIKDCYNASFDTTINAIKNLDPNKRKILVLGAMRGFEKKSKKMHEKLVDFAKKYSDNIFFLGDEYKHIKNINVFDDHKSLALSLKNILKKDDVVLVKGSRFYEMEKIFEFI
jgi:UDP-N-acetylmuramoyl-tripeptide--D-alanyl-D-alanine ligase